MARAMSSLSSLFKSHEDVIRLKFLPAVLRRSVTDLERDILSLPARFGGLGVFNPCNDCVGSYKDSKILSEPLVCMVMDHQSDCIPGDLGKDVAALRVQLEVDREEKHKKEYDMLFKRASSTMQSCMTIAREKGASSWVTACPTYDHDTALNKGDFIDSVCIRYGWSLSNLPDKCVCGATFDVQHALDCMIGGYRNVMHNEVRDTVVNVLKEAG